MQDKKRRKEENGATDGSQHPLASFCVREKKQKQVQRNRCRAMEIQERRKVNFKMEQINVIIMINIKTKNQTNKHLRFQTKCLLEELLLVTEPTTFPDRQTVH